ncbi:MAG: hypothetical protein MJ060_04115, partial [Clostridia bacterium]|nr:hypothetical protein [Clostridia bacterium]
AFRDLGAKHISTEIETPTTLIEDYNHIYYNPNGSIAYYKHRQKWSNGSKKFSFFYIDENNNTVYRKPENCNVLYNLHLMQQAIDAGDTNKIFIVEGEKCADILTDAGLLATTSNTGAKAKIPFTETDLNLLNLRKK